VTEEAEDASCSPARRARGGCRGPSQRGLEDQGPADVPGALWGSAGSAGVVLCWMDRTREKWLLTLLLRDAKWICEESDRIQGAFITGESRGLKSSGNTSFCSLLQAELVHGPQSSCLVWGGLRVALFTNMIIFGIVS